MTVTPVERTALALGEQLPLAAGRSFGAEAELRVAPTRLGKIHGRLAQRDGQWRLLHAAEDLSTFVNGRLQNEAALQHLDVLELPDHGPVFRFLTAPVGEGKPAPHLTLADPAGLAVWADTLQEANDPLGERIVRALEGEQRPGDDARFLGPLARTFGEGRLDVEWRHGLVARAVLRDLQPHGPEPLSSVQQLLALPAAALLEDLTLDAGGARSAAQAFVAVLNDPGTKVAPGLARLSLGDCALSDLWVDGAEAALGQALAARYPGLRRATLFGRFRRAALVLERAGAPQPGDVMELGDFAELIDAAPPSRGAVGVAFSRLQRRHAHWEIETVPPTPEGLTLNGRPVARAALRDGDHLKLATGAAYRLRLER